jgi:hypothetical protein
MFYNIGPRSEPDRSGYIQATGTRALAAPEALQAGPPFEATALQPGINVTKPFVAIVYKCSL